MHVTFRRPQLKALIWMKYTYECHKKKTNSNKTKNICFHLFRFFGFNCIFMQYIRSSTSTDSVRARKFSGFSTICLKVNIKHIRYILAVRLCVLNRCKWKTTKFTINSKANLSLRKTIILFNKIDLLALKMLSQRTIQMNFQWFFLFLYSISSFNLIIAF